MRKTESTDSELTGTLDCPYSVISLMDFTARDLPPNPAPGSFLDQCPVSIILGTTDTAAEPDALAAEPDVTKEKPASNREEKPQEELKTTTNAEETTDATKTAESITTTDSVAKPNTTDSALVAVKLCEQIEKFRSSMPREQLKDLETKLAEIDHSWSTTVERLLDRLQIRILKHTPEAQHQFPQKIIALSDEHFESFLDGVKQVASEEEIKTLLDYRQRVKDLTDNLLGRLDITKIVGEAGVKLKLVPDLHTAGGRYTIGKGEIHLRAQPLFSEQLSPDFVGTLLHELKHYEQDRLVMRYALGEVIEGKTNGLTDADIENVINRYLKELRIPYDSIDEDFVKRTIQQLAEQSGTKKLENDERQRAEALIKSLTENIEPQLLKFSGPARRMQEARTILRVGGIEALKHHIKDIYHDDLTTLFGKEPVKFDSMVQLDEILSRRIAASTTGYHEAYNRQLHEQEAKLVDEGGKAEARTHWKLRRTEATRDQEIRVVSDRTLPPFQFKLLMKDPHATGSQLRDAVLAEAETSGGFGMLSKLNRQKDGKKVAEIIFGTTIPDEIKDCLIRIEQIDKDFTEEKSKELEVMITAQLESHRTNRSILESRKTLRDVISAESRSAVGAGGARGAGGEGGVGGEQLTLRPSARTIERGSYPSFEKPSTSYDPAGPILAFESTEVANNLRKLEHRFQDVIDGWPKEISEFVEKVAALQGADSPSAKDLTHFTQKQIDSLTPELQRHINEFAQAHGIAAIELSLTFMPHDLGSFHQGEGKLCLNIIDIIGQAQGSDLKGYLPDILSVLTHELTHAEQDQIVVRYLARKNGIALGPKNPPSDRDIEHLRRAYREALGYDATNRWLTQCLIISDVAPDTARAEALIESFNNLHAVEGKLTALETELKDLLKHTRCLFAEKPEIVEFLEYLTDPKDGKEHRQKIFGDTIPQQIAALLEPNALSRILRQCSRSGPDDLVVRVLQKTVESRIDQLRWIWADTYRKQPHEVEADRSGTLTRDTLHKHEQIIKSHLELIRHSQPAEKPFCKRGLIDRQLVLEALQAGLEDTKEFTETEFVRYNQLIEQYKNGDPSASRTIHYRLGLPIQKWSHADRIAANIGRNLDTTEAEKKASKASQQVQSLKRYTIDFAGETSDAIKTDSIDLIVQYQDRLGQMGNEARGLDLYSFRFETEANRLLKQPAAIDGRVTQIKTLIQRFVADVPSLKNNPLLENVSVVTDKSLRAAGQILVTLGPDHVEPLFLDAKNAYIRKGSGGDISLVPIKNLRVTLVLPEKTAEQANHGEVKRSGAELISTVFHQLNQIDRLSSRLANLPKGSIAPSVGGFRIANQTAFDEFLRAEKSQIDLSADFMQYKLNGNSLNGTDIIKPRQLNADRLAGPAETIKLTDRNGDIRTFRGNADGYAEFGTPQKKPSTEQYIDQLIKKYEQALRESSATKDYKKQTMDTALLSERLYNLKARHKEFDADPVFRSRLSRISGEIVRKGGTATTVLFLTSVALDCLFAPEKPAISRPNIQIKGR